MGTFKHLQRKSSTGSTPATLASHRLRSSRPMAPAQVPTPEQVAHPQQTQPTHITRLEFSIADIPIFPPEREHRIGLPGTLQTGIENLSGMAMDDVHVHYNSSKPAEVQALAYTQGTDIHVGPGQEKHLPHEAWHVVQQKQGRVRPTLQADGVTINDDQRLEKEADEMGTKSVHGALGKGRLSLRYTGDVGELASEELSSVTAWQNAGEVVQCHPGPENLAGYHLVGLHKSSPGRIEHWVEDLKDRLQKWNQKVHGGTSLIGSGLSEDEELEVAKQIVAWAQDQDQYFVIKGQGTGKYKGPQVKIVHRTARRIGDDEVSPTFHIAVDGGVYNKVNVQ